MPARRINEIVLGKRSVTADTALRLAKFFGNSPRFWLGLQMDYDLDKASDELSRGDRAGRSCAGDVNHDVLAQYLAAGEELPFWIKPLK